MLQNIKKMMFMVKASQDPHAAISQLMENNPQMKQVMELVNASGGDPMKAFYAAAEERGVDPQEILNMLK
jgi:hypothetical protein